MKAGDGDGASSAPRRLGSADLVVALVKERERRLGPGGGARGGEGGDMVELDLVAAAGGGDGGRLWLGGGVGEKTRVWVFGNGRNEAGNAQKKKITYIYIKLVREV